MYIKWLSRQLFFNGELDEEIYMKKLDGFTLPGNEHKSAN